MKYYHRFNDPFVLYGVLQKKYYILVRICDNVMYVHVVMKELNKRKLMFGSFGRIKSLILFWKKRLISYSESD
jgi:hypothetical protein